MNSEKSLELLFFANSVHGDGQSFTGKFCLFCENYIFKLNCSCKFSLVLISFIYENGHNSDAVGVLSYHL